MFTKFNDKSEFEEHTKLALSADGRFETEDISPSIIRTDVDKIILVRHGFPFSTTTDWSPELPKGYGLTFASIENIESLRAKQFMSLMKIDQMYCFVSAYGYLKEKGILEPNTRTVPSGLALSPAQMDRNLTSADWDALFERYYALKREHVEIMIESFTEPHMFKNLDGSLDLKDFLIQRVSERLEKNR